MSSEVSGPRQQMSGHSDRRAIKVAANRIDTAELFAGTREVLIAHGEDVYRLRLTSQNKLILTK